MIIKLVLLLTVVSLAAAPESCAGWISDAQMEELYLILSEEEFVEVANRRLTPVSKTDMNITVIDDADLKNMNAHTLAEALNRIPGVYVSFFGADFGGTSLLNPYLPLILVKVP